MSVQKPGTPTPKAMAMGTPQTRSGKKRVASEDKSINLSDDSSSDTGSSTTVGDPSAKRARTFGTVVVPGLSDEKAKSTHTFGAIASGSTDENAKSLHTFGAIASGSVDISAVKVELETKAVAVTSSADDRSTKLRPSTISSDKGNHVGSCKCACKANLKNAEANLKLIVDQKCVPDWTIVSSDEEEFPFHKPLLASKSKYFQQLFAQKDSWECLNKRIKMSRDMEMDGQAVDAFLRYLYYRDTSTMENNLKIALIMIRVGYYCRMAPLLEDAAQVLVSVQDYSRFEDCLNELAKLAKVVHAWGPSPVRSKLREITLKAVSSVFELGLVNGAADKALKASSNALL